MMTRYWAIRVVVQVSTFVAGVQIAGTRNGVHDGCIWSSAVQKSLGPLPPGAKRQTAPALPPAGVVARRLTGIAAARRVPPPVRPQRRPAPWSVHSDRPNDVCNPAPSPRLTSCRE